MPKLKSKSSAKKRFSRTGTGKVRMNPARKQHNLSKRPKKMKRQTRGSEIMNDTEARRVRQYLPYA